MASPCPVRLAGCLTASLCLIASPALAQDGPHCGTFRVFTQFVDVQHIDHGEPGRSVGDARHGLIRYSDEAGNHVGRLVFSSVMSPGEQENEFILLGRGEAQFANGSISYQGTAIAPDPANAAPAASEITASVLGGTGAFAGARGEARFFTDDSGRRVSEYVISCGD